MELQDDISIKEQPVKILDRRDQVLRGKVIHLVKVAWSRHSDEEATWEREDKMREKYPELFEEQ